MTPDELLDATLEKAREVPIGGKVDPAVAARRAVEAARVEARVRRARRGRFLAGAAAAAAVVGLAWGGWALSRGWDEGDRAAAPEAPTRPGETEVGTSIAEASPTSDEPSEFRMSSGDLLVGSSDVAFDVVSEARDREVRLDRGELLLDVVHEPEGSFTVRTDAFSVKVLGTVFAVRCERDAVGVRVFEGSVLVLGPEGEERQRLGAGDIWASGTLDAMEEWRARSDRQWLALEGRGRGSADEPHRASGTSRTASESDEVEASGAEAEAPSDVDPSLADARTSLARGELARVLELSEAHPSDGRWLLLRADALRGLGRDDDAARAYEAAARALRGARRFQAAFAAAQLRAPTAPADALRLLDRFGVTGAASPLQERARAMRIRLLRDLGRDDEADAEERAHAERFGAGVE